MPKICPNCGSENDVGAKFCEKCGADLVSRRMPRPFQSPPIKEGMATSTKVLIIACIVLVAGLGLTIGILWQSNAANTPVSVSQSGEQVTYKASWHEVASFTGTSNDYRTFQTKGQRFKVVMSATPLMNYATNSMSVDISNSNSILSSGSLDWGATDALTTKEKTIEITGPPGTYWVNVYANELESWTVKVYDYY